jgi:hypothetical protein
MILVPRQHRIFVPAERQVSEEGSVVMNTFLIQGHERPTYRSNRPREIRYCVSDLCATKIICKRLLVFSTISARVFLGDVFRSSYGLLQCAGSIGNSLLWILIKIKTKKKLNSLV